MLSSEYYRLGERLLSASFMCLAIMELIHYADLTKTVSSVVSVFPRLISELIVNLPVDFDDLSASKFMKVHIRGFCML